MKFNTLVFSRICGLAAPFVALTFTRIAYQKSPWFQWTKENLSLLGLEGPGKIFFNGGLVLTAILTMIFIIGLGKSLPLWQTLERLGILTLSLGSVALAIIGLVPRSHALPHNIASGAFFILMPLGVFTLGLSLAKYGKLTLAIFSLATAILIIGLQLAPWPWQGGAIPQLLSMLPWSVWMISVAIILLLKPNLLSEQLRP